MAQAAAVVSRDSEADPRSEVEHCVRVAAIEQALALGLHRLAEVADRSTDPVEIVDAAVRDTCRVLDLPREAEESIRLAVTVGVLVGRLLGAIRRDGG